jgi:hypothetical protein
VATNASSYSPHEISWEDRYFLSVLHGIPRPSNNIVHPLSASDLARRLPLLISFRGTQTVLRISIIDESEGSVRLSLEGWLVGPWVDELRKQSEQTLSERKTLTLDLAKVWFVDPRGTMLLRELATRQVEHVNCSAFLTQQLKETTI